MYHEYKYDGEEISYQKPPSASCQLQGFNYLTDTLPDLIYTLGSGTFIITVDKPQVCVSDILVVTTSFDSLASLPSFVKVNQTYTQMIYDLSSVSSNDIGVYTMRITYTVGTV